jgi:hypothetical protein
MTNVTLAGPLASHGPGGFSYPASPAASAQGTAWSTNTGVAFYDNGENYLWCWNGSGSVITATVAFATQVEGQAVTAFTPALPAGVATALGPYSPHDFTAHDGTGLTYITFSSVTSLYVALYQLIPVQ